jgi:hypothetical protein
MLRVATMSLKAIDPMLEQAIKESGDDTFLVANLVVKGEPGVKPAVLLLALIERVEGVCGQLPNRVVFFPQLGMMAITGKATVIKTFLDQEEVIAAEAVSEGGVPSEKELAALAARYCQREQEPAVLAAWYRRWPFLYWTLPGLTAILALVLIGGVFFLVSTLRNRGEIQKELTSLNRDLNILKSPAYALLSLPDPVDLTTEDARHQLEINRELEALARTTKVPPRVLAYDLGLSFYRLKSKGIRVDQEHYEELLLGMLSTRKLDSYEQFRSRLSSYEGARLAEKTHRESMRLIWE